MKKLLLVSLMSISFTSSLLATEVPCRFIVKSNMISAVNVWNIDGISEPILIEQGKEVTEDRDQAHFTIYITHKYKIADPVFGSFHYKKSLTMSVVKNDGVVVFRKVTGGGPTEANKRELLESLEDIKFKCSDE